MVRTEIAGDIAVIAGPREWGDSRASWLARVPENVRKALGTTKATVSHRMVKALWYGEYANDPEHHAARDIRKAAAMIRAQQQAQTLADQLQAIAGGLDASNSELLGGVAVRLRGTARRLGGVDRA